MGDFIMGVRLASMILGLIREYRASGESFDLASVLPSFLTGLGQLAGIKELSAENINVLTPLLTDLFNSIRSLREPSAGTI